METLKQYEEHFSSAPWAGRGVPDHVSLWGLLIPIRREFDEYVNLRPVRLFEGVPSPLANRKPGDIDFWVVRENTEGEYSSVGGPHVPGHRRRGWRFQQAIFTRKGVDRVLKYAFEFASTTKKKHVTSAHQVQRHHPHHAVLGRALRRDGGRSTQTSRRTSITSTS